MMSAGEYRWQAWVCLDEHVYDEGRVALLPSVPVAGMFCGGEFGPAGPKGTPSLHGCMATLGLLVSGESEDTS